MRLLFLFGILAIAAMVIGTILIAIGNILFFSLAFIIKALLVVALVLVIIRLLQGKRVF